VDWLDLSRSSRSRVVAAFGVATLLSVAAVPAVLSLPASAVAVTAAAAPTYKVTYVALECDDYPDVMANRARNNIQESLKDLGVDTKYADGPHLAPLVLVTLDVATSR
jgi:hypothetical protein